MRKLIPFLFTLCLVQAFGQTSGYHRVGQVIARANSGVTANVVPYASVYVQNSTTLATAVIYQDPGLSIQITTGIVSADLSGNYGYYIPTSYCVNETISAPGMGSLSIQNICQNGGGGSSLAISTNNDANSSQTALNFQTSTANADGLILTPYNPSGGIETFEISGSYTGNSPTATKLNTTGGNGAYWGVSGGVQQWLSPPGGGTVTSVAMTVPSWLTVSGSPITGAGTFGVTGTSESQNLVLASPNGSSGAMSPRALVTADLPAGVPTTFPGAGVANSTGSSWGSSYSVGTSANNLVQLNGSAQLPAVSAALLTNFPTFNQNTAGYAAGLAGELLGSVPYQNAVNTTLFVASPTTSGHTFFYGWQPSGSAIAPASIDLATYLASPPAIGGSAAASGSFTSLSASSTVSGSGFSTYLASPPAIGGTAPAVVNSTYLTESQCASAAQGTITVPCVVAANIITGQTAATGSTSTVFTTSAAGLYELTGGCYATTASSGSWVVYAFASVTQNGMTNSPWLPPLGQCVVGTTAGYSTANTNQTVSLASGQAIKIGTQTNSGSNTGGVFTYQYVIKRVY